MLCYNSVSVLCVVVDIKLKYHVLCLGYGVLCCVCISMSILV